jgi:N6-L-threonylcarbamoyladenine synthase
MIILGIETSCDETAAAVVKDGTRILSSVVSSQIDVHRLYGGVVPELASRKHIEAIVPVVESALGQADISLKDLDAIAATQGPGLVGALLVGFSFAKACAYTLGIPWIGVDHLEGHINSVFLDSEPPPFPFVVLLVSGGHTSIYHVTDYTAYELMGRTRDDAAGEAYDKVAKMLNLGYPGGVVIDQLATEGNPKRIKFPRSFLDKTAFDFSFSGLKTAVLKIVRETPEQERDADFVRDVAASFQEAVDGILVSAIEKAAAVYKTGSVIIAGGVAVNSLLRSKALEMAERRKMKIFFPEAWLCTDNAAMVAALGCRLLSEGRIAGYDLDAEPDLKLGEKAQYKRPQ